MMMAKSLEQNRGFGKASIGSRGDIDREQQGAATVADKSWGRMTSKEKQETLRADVAAAMARLDQIERRLDDIRGGVASDVSRLSQMITEVNVRLSAVAANVLEVSAIARSAAEALTRSEQEARLRPDPRVEIKK